MNPDLARVSEENFLRRAARAIQQIDLGFLDQNVFLIAREAG